MQKNEPSSGACMDVGNGKIIKFQQYIDSLNVNQAMS